MSRSRKPADRDRVPPHVLAEVSLDRQEAAAELRRRIEAAAAVPGPSTSHHQGPHARWLEWLQHRRVRIRMNANVGDVIRVSDQDIMEAGGFNALGLAKVGTCADTLYWLCEVVDLDPQS